MNSDQIDGVNKQKTTSQQQLSLITDEMKQFERQTKQNFARLSSLASDLLAQVKFTKIQQWDSGKYSESFSSSPFET